MARAHSNINGHYAKKKKKKIELQLMCHHPSSSRRMKKELHIAPMLNYSTREFRQLLRILSRRAVLWTEMVVDDTIAHATNLDEHLGGDEVVKSESNFNALLLPHPIICQIGGNSPELCGKATSIILQTYGYDECNLNIDCPSERVTSGRREFGAVLMKKAELAKEIVKDMQTNVNYDREETPDSDSGDNTPSKIISNRVSVKCRIGVDDMDDLEFAAQFIQTLQPVCHRFYLHARKCVLNGLMNARQNRTVPPLNYPRVYELCRLFPDCEFWINGGIKTLKEARYIAYGRMHNTTEGNDATEILCSSNNNDGSHQVPCQLCDITNGSCIAPPMLAPHNLRGVMMGRAAIDDPCLFHDVDRYFYGDKNNPCKNRRDVLEQYCKYLERTYTRRCCDDDERMSFEHPMPNVVLDYDYCEQCADVYGGTAVQDGNSSEWLVGQQPKRNRTKQQQLISDKNGNQLVNNKPKMASKIIARSLKPVQGIFNGVPNSRAFRRCCDELGQDVAVRNCGPGYILRKAMQSVPSEVLDREF